MGFEVVLVQEQGDGSVHLLAYAGPSLLKHKRGAIVLLSWRLWLGYGLSHLFAHICTVNGTYTGTLVHSGCHKEEELKDTIWAITVRRHNNHYKQVIRAQKGGGC